MFQCSSASRKFLNTQRQTLARHERAFQCSSASRKFLNGSPGRRPTAGRAGFSALQRAENSSTRAAGAFVIYDLNVSVLFSEPKIPQRGCVQGIRVAQGVSVLFSEPKIPQPGACLMNLSERSGVSVLFSEPKIPQHAQSATTHLLCECFSALQRAENSSTRPDLRQVRTVAAVSVLFSEPKIPQH